MQHVTALLATAGAVPLAYVASLLLAEANGPTKRFSLRSIALPIALITCVFVGLLFGIYDSLVTEQVVGLRGRGPYLRYLDPWSFWSIGTLMYLGAAASGGVAHRFLQFSRSDQWREP